MNLITMLCPPSPGSLRLLRVSHEPDPRLPLDCEEGLRGGKEHVWSILYDPPPEVR